MLLAGIEPVFVFEGNPPELKSKTLIRRKVTQFKQSMNYKKLAEKFIIRMSKQTNQSEEQLQQRILQLQDIKETEIDDSKLQELNLMMTEFEELYEFEENQERDIKQEILLKQNEEYIADHGMTLEEFRRIPEQIQ